MDGLFSECAFIFDNLNANGFECYAVGGCVRDMLSGRVPDDIDFATNAAPEEIKSCFSQYKTIDIGIKYGTVCVINNSIAYEITTYRSDLGYSDSRHPDGVRFSSKLSDDLSRRDFTINAMAYNGNGIVDLFGGAEDLHNGVIRCVGDPNTRLCEDAIRIIRALRFSSKLGFSIDSATADSIHTNCVKVKLVHPQRIAKELTGLLCGCSAAAVLMQYPDVVTAVVPELSRTVGFDQNNPHHRYDVYTHTVKAIENSPQDITVRLALLFHDIEKPTVMTVDRMGLYHFKGHPEKSAETANTVLRRFGFPGELARSVCELVRFHDERYRHGNSDIRLLFGILGAGQYKRLMQVHLADTLAQSEYRLENKLEFHEQVKAQVQDIITNDVCCTVGQLKINGSDLLGLGFSSGESVGSVLDALLDMVITGACNNDRDELTAVAKQFVQNKS